MLFDLRDHTILIINGNGKMGEAIIAKLLSSEANAVVAERENSDYVLRVFCQDFKLKVSSIHAAVEFVLKRFGKIDGLINNIEPLFLNTGKKSEQNNAEKQMLHAKEFCSICGEVMKRQNGGSIVNITSAAGTAALKSDEDFSAAYAGIQNYTKKLALELGEQNVRVNAVSFGALEDLGDGFDHFDRFSQRMLSHVPQGRKGTCSEIADAVLFLCSKESSYITGQVLIVDGGWVCGFHRDF